MKKIFSAIIMAISTYTKIPMPRLSEEAAAEGYRNALAAFPLCGLFVAVLHLTVLILSAIVSVPEFVQAVLLTIAPVLVTGGIHLDGYMDVRDAVSSYRSVEKKIEIMKDPHVGAFAVMSLAVYLLLMTAVSYEEAVLFGIMASKKRVIFALAATLIFFLGRCASALSVLLLPKLRSEGMASEMSKNIKSLRGEQKMAVRGMIADGRVRILIFEAVVGSIVLAAMPYMLGEGVYRWAGVILLAVMTLVIIRFVKVVKSEFGGINGDLAGYCLCQFELISLATLTIVSFVAGGGL